MFCDVCGGFRRFFPLLRSFLPRFIRVRRKAIRGIWKGINLREIERFDFCLCFFFVGYWDHVDVKFIILQETIYFYDNFLYCK